MDEHASGPAAAPGRPRSLCLGDEAKRACARAAELARVASAARNAAAIVLIEAQHARERARATLEGAAAARADGLAWLRSRGERIARRAASRPASSRPAGPASPGRRPPPAETKAGASVRAEPPPGGAPVASVLPAEAEGGPRA